MTEERDENHRFTFNLSVIKLHGTAAERPDPGEYPEEIVLYEEVETGVEHLDIGDEWVQVISQPVNDVSPDPEDRER